MSGSTAEKRQRRGFTLVESLVALAVLGGALAVALPPLSAALGARASREGLLDAVLLAQSLLEAHAPPGAAREGRWQGEAAGGTAWRVEVGAGEAGAGGVTLRPVRVVAGRVVLDTLRPGPAAPP
jgi:prepilin-type N-terminal cleavage/methylation domain-containing protein